MEFQGQMRTNYKTTNGVTIQRGVKFLQEVEDHRRWEKVNTNKMDIRGGKVKVGKKSMGILSPFAFQQLRRQVNARKHQLMYRPDFKKVVENGDKEMQEQLHMKIVSEKLAKLDKPMFLRIQEMDRGTPHVLTALTQKYEHLPYPSILKAFPAGMRINRFHVDHKYLSFHISESGFISKGLKAGFRVTSSDIGASKLRVSYQIFRLVCLNGLMLPETIFSFKKMHMGAIQNSWEIFVNKKIKQLPLFKKNISKFIKTANKDEISKNDATDELLDMNVPRKRIERALQIAEGEFKRITRWSVANGLSQASHEDRPGNIPVAISTAAFMDQSATSFMRI